MATKQTRRSPNTMAPIPGRTGASGAAAEAWDENSLGIKANTTRGHSYLDGQGAAPGQTGTSGVADTRPAPTFAQTQECGPFDAPVGADEEKGGFHCPG